MQRAHEGHTALLFIVALAAWAWLAFDAGRRIGLEEARETIVPAAVASALAQRPMRGVWVPVGPDMDCRRDEGSLAVRLNGDERVLLTDSVGVHRLPPPRRPKPLTVAAAPVVPLTSKD